MGTFRAIGLMSGTSLDGLDMVDVTFGVNTANEWNFRLNHAAIYTYSDEMLAELSNVHRISAHELCALSAKMGKFYAEKVNVFRETFQIQKQSIDFIASHGQTVFHQPEKGFTLQIGNGPELTTDTALPSIVDFRSKDVALGGNGAPLIPVADFLLFNSYADSFLNLGGFSNFSFKEKRTVYSFDSCPVNSVLNFLMKKEGQSYDKNGAFGRTGKINTQLLVKLNQLPFYRKMHPKSLGWEWVEAEILPLLEKETNNADALRTYYEHCAFQMGKTINQSDAETTLMTGGGAKNKFLIERLKNYTNNSLLLPDNDIIDYKEAIGFAFLGMLRWTNKVNVWASVTGANEDSCSGRIVYP